MKRISIISKIILVVQLAIALKYATLFGLDIFDFLHNVISDGFAIEWGLIIAIPFSLLAVGVEAVHKKHFGTEENKKHYKFMYAIHIVLGLWNFFVSGALNNI